MLNTPTPHDPLKLCLSSAVSLERPSWLTSARDQALLTLCALHEAEAVLCSPLEVAHLKQQHPHLLCVALQAPSHQPSQPLQWGEPRADEVAWHDASPRELEALLTRLKARAQRHTHAQSAEQRALALELASQSLSSAHDERLIFQKLVDIVAEQLQSERVSLLSVSHERGELQMRAAHGIPEHIIAQARPKIGEGIAGLCAQRGEPIFISDHDRFRSGERGAHEGAEPPRPMSLTIPILTRGEVVGVVNVTGRAHESPYQQQDIAFLSALMSHAGYLMESARLVSNLTSLKRFSDQVINTLDDPLVVLDLKGELLKENHSFGKLYYQTTEGLEERPDDEERPSLLSDLEHLPTPLDLAEGEMSPLMRWLSRQDETLHEPLSQALREGKAWRREGWRSGDRVFDLKLIPFDTSTKDHEGAEGEASAHQPRALLYFQDVTLRQQMQRQLVSAEKMASLGILSAGVAHEVNNPLGFVKTNTKEAGRYFDDLFEVIDAWHDYAQSHKLGDQLPPFEVERDIELDEVRSDAPTLIRESLDGLDRIQKIIASLKSFAHPDTESTREVQLSTLVEHALVITQGKWRHHLTITKELPEHPPLSCIPNQLEQVFMNLLVNAAQATQSRGVSATMEITLTEPAEGWLELRFKDSCGGIPAEVVERIFDPFFTTKDIGEGTGLGLHIAHNIIEGHGGQISVESDPPRGTTFVILLPLGERSGPLVIKQLSRFKV